MAKKLTWEEEIMKALKPVEKDWYEPKAGVDCTGMKMTSGTPITSLEVEHRFCALIKYADGRLHFAYTMAKRPHEAREKFCDKYPDAISVSLR